MKRKSKFRSVLRNILLWPVWLYKVAISPIIPHSCIFFPTCSTYMVQAVREFGIFKGGWIGIKRLFRCNPKQKKRGYDPIPINIKGEGLWIL